MTERDLKSIKAIAVHEALVALEPQIAMLYNPHGCKSLLTRSRSASRMRAQRRCFTGDPRCSSKVSRRVTERV